MKLKNALKFEWKLTEEIFQIWLFLKSNENREKESRGLLKGPRVLKISIHEESIEYPKTGFTITLIETISTRSFVVLTFMISDESWGWTANEEY